MKVNRDVDPALIQRGTQIFDVIAAPGTKVWKLVYAKFFPKGQGAGQAGGRINCFVEAIDENGVQIPNIIFIMSWSTGKSEIITNGRTGFDAGNQPFSPGENAFTVSRENGDTVHGVGMGEDTPQGFNPGAHTCTLLRFQRLSETGVITPEPPIPPIQPPSSKFVTMISSTFDADEHLVKTLTFYSDGSYADTTVPVA